MTNISKSDLAATVAAKTGRTKADAAMAIDAIIETIKAETDAGAIVKIAGFGKFEKKSRAARLGRNPGTGAAIEIPATTVLTFKPGKAKAE